MTDLYKKWEKFNEDRISKGKTTIPFEKWIREYYTKNPVFKTIKYLELNKECPNFGTKNKNELMKRMITTIFEWTSGTESEWRSKLSIRLNLSTRTVRENYLNPLIEEGIIVKIGSILYFVGPPEEVDDVE